MAKDEKAPAPESQAPAPAPAPVASAPAVKEKTAYEGQATTTVDLDRARIVRGTAYGPGKGVKVPQAVADAIQAESRQAAKGTKQGKGKQK